MPKQEVQACKRCLVATNPNCDPGDNERKGQGKGWKKQINKSNSIKPKDGRKAQFIGRISIEVTYIFKKGMLAIMDCNWM